MKAYARTMLHRFAAIDATIGARVSPRPYTVSRIAT